MIENDKFKAVGDFYDEAHYTEAEIERGHATWHGHLIARRLGDLQGKRALDVACGLG